MRASSFRCPSALLGASLACDGAAPPLRLTKNTYWLPSSHVSVAARRRRVLHHLGPRPQRLHAGEAARVGGGVEGGARAGVCAPEAVTLPLPLPPLLLRGWGVEGMAAATVRAFARRLFGCSDMPAWLNGGVASARSSLIDGVRTRQLVLTPRLCSRKFSSTRRISSPLRQPHPTTARTGGSFTLPCVAFPLPPESPPPPGTGFCPWPGADSALRCVSTTGEAYGTSTDS